MHHIEHLNEEAMKRAKIKWNTVCKPLNSLGKFEDLIIQLAGIQGTEEVTLDKRCALIMCSDNGVVEEGVTQTGQEVTKMVAESIAEGKANINSIAATARADVFAIDVGIAGQVKNTKVIDKKIAFGTKNIAKEPAMTLVQAKEAVQIGIDLAGEMKTQGYHIIVTGEMGIGNTTTTSAIVSTLLNVPVSQVTGRGAGLTLEGCQHKQHIIEKAIEVNKPNRDDPWDVLGKLGGFDIAAMTGIFLGGAIHKIPIVIDGVISAVGALIAVKIHSLAKEYMIASHQSKEPAGILLMEELALSPIIYGDLCLGEGTGAVLLLPLLDGALAVYSQTQTFRSAKMEPYKELK